MARGESLRGAGRDAYGPLLSTHRIHDWIKRHPGCSREEVVDAALREEWVDRGYAHRAYARRLNALAKQNFEDRGTRVAPSSESPASVAADRSDKAVRHVVRKTLSDMLKLKSIRKDNAGGLHVVRELQPTQGLTREQIITTPEQNRALAAEIEVLRALRPFVGQLSRSYFRVPLEVRRKLEVWVQAKQVQPPPRT